jgi:hypothetical protein
MEAIIILAFTFFQRKMEGAGSGAYARLPTKKTVNPIAQ